MSSIPPQVFLWKIVSCLCFAGMNTLLKGIRLPYFQTACLQNVLAALLMAGWLSHFPFTLLKKPLYWARSAVALSGVLLWAYSIQKLMLFQAVAMGFLGPFLTILGARLFLQEPLTWRRTLAIGLAAAGGLCVTYNVFLPSNWALPQALGPFLGASLAASASFSAVNLMSKSLASQASPLALAFSLVATVGGLLLITLPTWRIPSLLEAGALASLGFLTAGAHLSLHYAMQKTDLTLLMPMGALKAIATALLGWLFFHEKPTESMWAGSFIIIFALSFLTRRKPSLSQ